MKSQVKRHVLSASKTNKNGGNKMWYLFDCYNQVMGRYKTLRGLKCAATRQEYKLLEKYWQAVENNIPCENHYMMTRFINSVKAS